MKRNNPIVTAKLLFTDIDWVQCAPIHDADYDTDQEGSVVRDATGLHICFIDEKGGQLFKFQDEIPIQ